jgi:hypothetical protein
MSGRRVSLAGIATLLVGLTGVIVVACYDLPTPDCGFVCGPDNGCPDGYTCADDHYCHRIGAPSALVCAGPDAAVPFDAAADGGTDATIDATLDVAPVDAGPDAAPDAPIDALPDAAPDAPIDAALEPVDATVDAADATQPPP